MTTGDELVPAPKPNRRARRQQKREPGKDAPKPSPRDKKEDPKKDKKPDPKKDAPKKGEPKEEELPVAVDSFVPGIAIRFCTAAEELIRLVEPPAAPAAGKK